jgi:glycosyltransferase involved in cell wall biosynthesis
MRILFAGKQHYDPGGIPASIDQLAQRLVRVGHRVAVIAHAALHSPPPPPEVDRTAVRREPAPGYDAYSIDLLPPSVGLDIVARGFRPDVIVVNAGGSWWHDWTRSLVQSAPAGLPLVIYLRDHQALDLLDELADRVDLVLANSEHLAARAAAHGVSATVIPSLIEPLGYKVDSTREAVVFINPVASRGVETAFAIAEQRPDVPFHFRESWQLPSLVAEGVARRAQGLDNVTFLRSTDDPREPYRCARLLLVPYADRGRPRVVAEAHVSGIPVLARDLPPLREAVGPGGILVPDGAPIADWIVGLSTLWDDQHAHLRYAEAACRHSRREEIDPARVARHFEEVVSRLLGAPVRRRLRPALSGTPLASVVVPVRNAAMEIDRQLAALAGQSSRAPWEVIVADNGSSDDTRERAEAWRGRLPSLTVLDASARRGVAHARNVGIRAARGELLMICDGDDIVADGWLSAMLEALDEHPIVSGQIDLRAMNRPEQYAWTGDADRAEAPIGYDFMPYAHGGNVGMWREVFDALGGFEETLLRAEDIDFGWRAADLGISIYHEPRAVLLHRMRPSARAVFRGAIRGGRSEPGLFRLHRDRGMPRAELNEVIVQYRWLWRTIPEVVSGRSDRHHWAHHAGKRVGRVLGSLRHRALYL